MGILIANLGTSDLAVKIDDYYFPIKFNRNEPNIIVDDLNENESAAWQDRDAYVQEFLCDSLKADPYSFRDLTEKILKEYQSEPQNWQERILPGRIWGAIAKAYEEFNIKTVYMIVTDQEPSVTQRNQDTIHLFTIVQIWLKQKYPDLVVKPIIIPDTIAPVDLDQLLDYYYSFFCNLTKQISEEELVLVSIKGGTPQMQSALKIQSIAANIQSILFIDPTLDIKAVLNGQASECQLTCYWKYFRQQKYQTVEQLLQRWDFTGAIEILRVWKRYLKFISRYQILDLAEVEENKQKNELIIKVLDCARCLFELDLESAQAIIQDISLPQLTILQDIVNNQNNSKYSVVLNLYSQSLIYNDLNEIGNFLTTFCTFNEAVLYQIIEKNGGNQYLDSQTRRIQSNFQQDIGQELYSSFNINNSDTLYLNNRFIQRNFIQTLLEYRQNRFNQSGLLDNWRRLKELLDSLEYWILQRNDLIHSGKGISLRKVQELNQQRYNETPEYKEIVKVMAQMLHNPLLQTRNEYKDKFVDTANYYIYSSLRDWAIAQLQQ